MRTKPRTAVDSWYADMQEGFPRQNWCNSPWAFVTDGGTRTSMYCTWLCSPWERVFFNLFNLVFYCLSEVRCSSLKYPPADTSKYFHFSHHLAKASELKDSRLYLRTLPKKQKGDLPVPSGVMACRAVLPSCPIQPHLFHRINACHGSQTCFLQMHPAFSGKHQEMANP